ncbi:Sulfite reduction-associated complex, DsrJ [Desulfatibacillum aliphaticivorans]|uniref:Sulfite reduction-associated complex, DsrJ n=1 Tax=Desulfatibacillum aliphaticivorans TaxID=218208 RepID=B8FJN4_DESAL|nr:sulfate reduction electron transfer complex DsrMKJOP subunit DsrJ [Desulfatibacillum aliphaticivorans]ACL02312.1 Sulfite reduction-associated complex, DsrJ [Desulfatibacillum aliphaticivorans]
MYDSGKIITGLVIFVALFASPFILNVGGGAPAVPQPSLDTPAIKSMGNPVCVRENMQSNHMQVLDLWRDSVVRDMNHTVPGIDGQLYEMSLSNTCMECHSNKAEFCDRCHTYAAVDPFCWDCHIEPPKEG